MLLLLLMQARHLTAAAAAGRAYADGEAGVNYAPALNHLA